LDLIALIIQNAIANAAGMEYADIQERDVG